MVADVCNMGIWLHQLYTAIKKIPEGRELQLQFQKVVFEGKVEEVERFFHQSQNLLKQAK